jgi:hypothetical protein
VVNRPRRPARRRTITVSRVDLGHETGSGVVIVRPSRPPLAVASSGARIDLKRLSPEDWVGTLLLRLRGGRKDRLMPSPPATVAEVITRMPAVSSLTALTVLPASRLYLRVPFLQARLERLKRRSILQLTSRRSGQPLSCAGHDPGISARAVPACACRCSKRGRGAGSFTSSRSPRMPHQP